MSRHDLAVASGCTAALVTALRAGDGDLWADVLVGLPPLDAALEDAGILLRDSAYAVLSCWLRQPAQTADVVHLWEDARDTIAWALAIRYDLPARTLPHVMDWLTAVLTDPGSARTPEVDPVLHLMVAAMVVEEFWAPHATWSRWPAFLLSREAVQ